MHAPVIVEVGGAFLKVHDRCTRAQVLHKEAFKRGVEKPLTGRKTRAWSRAAGSGNGGLDLGPDKSGGYCLEMICAYFLAGSNLVGGDPESLSRSLRRLLGMLSPQEKREILQPARYLSPTKKNSFMRLPTLDCLLAWLAAAADQTCLLQRRRPEVLINSVLSKKLRPPVK